MKALKKLVDTTTKKIVALVLALIVVGLVVLFVIDPKLGLNVLPLVLWTLLAVVVCWLAIHFGVKAWRKRKRKDFDEQVAAKEGIEDRRREWATWTDELEKQGIDRYELPFYLLVGEPQSGKSVLLHNSDLHFPFGQSRLSGVGGTRGCDWWFTEEAVVLDLAGRLFTHEGGAADRLEFEAFLELLYEFRPLCPVNGVMLVIPCDSLLKDTPEVSGAKATKIQAALHSLTTKLQAQLPIYLVLTKGDQVFGFAESVHRLDVDRRHQMFGWSRAAERIEAPFDLEEVRLGYQSMVQRARLLRAHMLAGARLPEALPEIDRMYAFPPELDGLYPNLEVYLKRIFSASNIVDRVYFRGLYLTSGLQTGIPIAKVCTELFGQPGEADGRDLEALFSKQRAYFIKDLIRERIFGERGLVRPTQGRVKQARQVARIGYGISAALVLASTVFAAVYLRDQRQRAAQNVDRFDATVDAVEGSGLEDIPAEDARAIEAVRKVKDDKAATLGQMVEALGTTATAIERERPSFEEFSGTTRGKLRALYCALFDSRVIPEVRRKAQDNLMQLLQRGPADHAELQQLVRGVAVLAGDVDFAAHSLLGDSPREIVLACLPEAGSAQASGPSLSLARAFVLREDYGPDEGMLSPAPKGQVFEPLLREAARVFERCLDPGSPLQPDGEIGFVLAWKGAEDSRKELMRNDLLPNASPAVFSTCHAYAGSVARLELLQPALGGTMASKAFLGQVANLGSERFQLQKAWSRLSGAPAANAPWPQLQALGTFGSEKIKGKTKSLFDFVYWFSNPTSSEAGQDLYAYLGTSVSAVTGSIDVPGDFDPLNEYRDLETVLVTVCKESLRPDPDQPHWTGLANRLSSLDKKMDTKVKAEHRDLFLAQCVAEGSLFSQLQDDQSVRAAFADADPGSSAPLRTGLVNELAGLHSAVSAVRDRELSSREQDKLRRWQSDIERLLFEDLSSLQQSGEASAWVAALQADGALSEEAWGQIEALGRAAGLVQVDERYQLVALARQLQLDAFLEGGKGLFQRWQQRDTLTSPKDPKSFLQQTARSASELRQLVSGATSRLKGQPEFAGATYDGWRRRVDELWDARLTSVESAVRDVWQIELPRDAGLTEAVSVAEREIEPQRLRERIDSSSARGLAQVAELVRLLPDKSPEWARVQLDKAAERAHTLQRWRAPATEADVLDSSELADLKRALERLRPLSSDQGPELAQVFLTFFVSQAQAPEPTNAGIGMVQELRAALDERLRNAIRDDYLRRLKDKLTESRFDPLRQALAWKPGETAVFDQDDHLVEQLDRLLKENGEFDALKREFRLTGAERPLEPILFPPPAAEELCQPSATLHHFLASLQKFLLEDGTQRNKSVRQAKLRFTLQPITEGDPQSLWVARGDDARNFFYFPDSRSPSRLQKLLIGVDKGAGKVDEWGFTDPPRDRELLLLWSNQTDQEKARNDTGRFEYATPSSLAPLLLAWQGDASEGCQAFDLLLKPISGTARSARMRLQFERAVPLPPAAPW